jgi:hypothetical protein
VLLLNYPQLTNGDTDLRNKLLYILLPVMGYLKKSGKMTQ